MVPWAATEDSRKRVVRARLRENIAWRSALSTFNQCARYGGVILPRFTIQIEVRAKKRRTTIGHEFFDRVSLIPPALRAKATIKPGGVHGPVGSLVREGRVKALRILEGFNARNVNAIQRRDVASLVSRLNNLSAGMGEKIIGCPDSPDGVSALRAPSDSTRPASRQFDPR